MVEKLAKMDHQAKENKNKIDQMVKDDNDINHYGHGMLYF
jgi:hypothetical protein